MMGWRTDWLYWLIFEQVEYIWEKAKKEGAEERLGIAPDYLLVQNCQLADWHSIHCQPPVLRLWEYDGKEYNEVLEKEISVQIRGMFYSVGTVQFHIAKKRDRVMICYVLGPRYARGRIWMVEGQGSTGRLVPDPQAKGWFT